MFSVPQCSGFEMTSYGTNGGKKLFTQVVFFESNSIPFMASPGNDEMGQVVDELMDKLRKQSSPRKIGSGLKCRACVLVLIGAYWCLLVLIVTLLVLIGALLALICAY